VTDLAPVKEKLAKCIRLFGAAERANARTMTERTLASVGANWTDLGDWIEHSFSEDEMHEIVDVIRKEERARAPQAPQINGHFVLPEVLEMAQYCHDRSGLLKDDNQRDFVDDMYHRAQRGMQPKRGPLGYLASLYIKLGGRI
jgi:hypothetical protein